MNHDPQKKYTAAELFVQLQSGSQEALHGLIILYRQPLTAYILLYIPNEEIAAEVFSETMLSLWLNKQKVAVFDNPYAWLVNVAHHNALNALRKEQTYREMLKQNEKPTPLFTSVEATVEYKDLMACIDMAAQRLSPREKQIFNLFIQNDWSARQIAQHCNVSENTVRNQLSSAMRKIRRHLKKIINGLFI